MESQTTPGDYWKKQLHHHDWYVRLEDFLQTTVFPLNPTPEEKEIRQNFYALVDKMLRIGYIPLASSQGPHPNFDEERKEIDTIVIHHTKEDFDISLTRLSAIGFIRQYAKVYLEDNLWDRAKLRGQPIWSGHFNQEGKMVFYAYHWLVRPSGEVIQLLKNQEIGHHSGEQSVDNRSIGIALSGDYGNSMPPQTQIEGTLKIIRENYPGIKNIVGHKDVRPDRYCPGNKWEEWKKAFELI